MQATGHGDRLDYDRDGYFHDDIIQNRWLGYRRCWEEQVLKQDTPTSTSDYGIPAPSTPSPPPEVECVFVGGPLHGLHYQDTAKHYRLVDHDGRQFLYRRWIIFDKDTHTEHTYYKIDCEDDR